MNSIQRTSWLVFLIVCSTTQQVTGTWLAGILNGTRFHMGYVVADKTQPITKDAHAVAVNPVTGLLKQVGGVRGDADIWTGPFSDIKTPGTLFPWPGQNEYGKPKRVTLCFINPEQVTTEDDLVCNPNSENFVQLYYLFDNEGRIVADSKASKGFKSVKTDSGETVKRPIIETDSKSFPSVPGAYFIYIKEAKKQDPKALFPKLEIQLLDPSAIRFAEEEIAEAKENYAKKARTSQQPTTQSPTTAIDKKPLTGTQAPIVPSKPKTGDELDLTGL